MLQDKIKEYLYDNWRADVKAKDLLAKDIAEICEKEINIEYYAKLDSYYKQLEKENAELKQKLADIKYLDRQEVHSLLLCNLGVHFVDNENPSKTYYEVGGIEYCVEAICNLAKPIDKDKIIEILKSKFDLDFDIHGNSVLVSDIAMFESEETKINYFEQIANEILGVKNEN